MSYHHIAVFNWDHCSAHCMSYGTLIDQNVTSVMWTVSEPRHNMIWTNTWPHTPLLHFTAVRRKGVISHFAVHMGFAGIIAGYVGSRGFTASEVFGSIFFTWDGTVYSKTSSQFIIIFLGRLEKHFVCWDLESRKPLPLTGGTVFNFVLPIILGLQCCCMNGGAVINAVEPHSIN